MEIMSERNKVSWNIMEIKNKLKDFKSNRKATLKLLSLVSGATFIMGTYYVYYESNCVYMNPKTINTAGSCRICHADGVSCVKIKINSNVVKFIICENCKSKKLCHSCLREVSRCSIIYSRKLLCYKILLSHKFPKDVIRLITKKVK